MKLSKAHLTAISIISVLIIAGGIYLLLSNSASQTFVPTEGLYCESGLDIASSLPNEMQFGDGLMLTLQLDPKEDSFLLQVIITVDSGGEEYREGISFDFILLEKGDSISLQLNYGSSLAGNKTFLALQPGNYSVNNIEVQYISCLSSETETVTLDQPFEVLQNGIENRAASAAWDVRTIDINTSAVSESSFTGSQFSIDSSPHLQRIELNTSLSLSGVLLLRVENVGLSNLSLFIDGSFNASSTNSTEFIFPLVTYANVHNLSLVLYVEGDTSATINMQMLTKRIKVMTAVIDDQWSSTFSPPQYYLDQVSERFTTYFNISFVISVSIPVVYEGGSDLFDLIDYSKDQFGKVLGLTPWGNDRVYNPSNFGLNMLLILTNKTMDHYGIVIGDKEGPYNIAVNAGGSVFAGGQRLSSSWGDNLFQHEISHVFGALDRYSSSDAPSVMTKASSASEVLSDILNNRLWLTLTHWLPEDLLLMMEVVLNFYS